MSLAVTLQIFACFFMTGVIWTIQLVHYPSFRYTTEQFASFHKFHSTRITWIVLPVMTVELLSATVIAYLAPSTLWISNLAGVVAIWTATALLSVPQHKRLAESFDSTASTKLIYTNWTRTCTWTVRSIVLAIVLLDLIHDNLN